MTAAAREPPRDDAVGLRVCHRLEHLEVCSFGLVVFSTCVFVRLVYGITCACVCVSRA